MIGTANTICVMYMDFIQLSVMSSTIQRVVSKRYVCHSDSANNCADTTEEDNGPAGDVVPDCMESDDECR